MRTEDERVFGPVDEAKLLEWAKEGRIAPTTEISTDSATWSPAWLMASLKMEWLVEFRPGCFYGPMNKAALDDFSKGGTVPSGARRLRCVSEAGNDSNSILVKSLQEQLAVKDKTIKDTGSRFAETVKTMKTSVEALEAKLKALHEENEMLKARTETQAAGSAAEVENIRKELKAAKAAAAAKDNDIAALRGSLEAAQESLKAAEEKAVADAAAFAAKESAWEEEKKAFAAEHEAMADLQRGLQNEVARSGETSAAGNARIAALEKEIARLNGELSKRDDVPEVEVLDAQPTPEAPSQDPGPARNSMAEIERQLQKELSRKGFRSPLDLFKHRK